MYSRVLYNVGSSPLLPFHRYVYVDVYVLCDTDRNLFMYGTPTYRTSIENDGAFDTNLSYSVERIWNDSEL